MCLSGHLDTSCKTGTLFFFFFFLFYVFRKTLHILHPRRAQNNVCKAVYVFLRVNNTSHHTPSLTLTNCCILIWNCCALFINYVVCERSRKLTGNLPNRWLCHQADRSEWKWANYSSFHCGLSNRPGASISTTDSDDLPGPGELLFSGFEPSYREPVCKWVLQGRISQSLINLTTLLFDFSLRAQLNMLPNTIKTSGIQTKSPSEAMNAILVAKELQSEVH